MKENPADPRTVLCDDCLAPEDTGDHRRSQREDDHDKLVERIKEEGLPMDAYGWYLDLRKYGTFVTQAMALASSERSRGSAGTRTSARALHSHV
jgi:asparaginyl-tRNA synthetase